MSDIHIEDCAGEASEIVTENANGFVFGLFLFFITVSGAGLFYEFFGSIVATVYASLVWFGGWIGYIAHSVYKGIYYRRTHLANQVHAMKEKLEKYQKAHGQGKLLLGVLAMSFMLICVAVVLYFWGINFASILSVGIGLIVMLVFYIELSKRRLKNTPLEELE